MGGKHPEILWAIRTTPTIANGESPFTLTFGANVVVPAKILIPSPRVEGYDPATNEGLNLDHELVKERREIACICNIQNKKEIT